MWLFHTHSGGGLKTRSYFLSWFLFGTNCTGKNQRGMSQKMYWPLASSGMLKAVCTVFPSDQPTCGAGWALGQGTRQELIRFPSFEVKNEPE